MALAAEMSGRRATAASHHSHVAEALVLMQATSIAELKDWLKSAGQEQLAAMLARLPDPALARVRSWLEWLAHQDSVVAWAALPQVQTD